DHEARRRQDAVVGAEHGGPQPVRSMAEMDLGAGRRRIVVARRASGLAGPLTLLPDGEVALRSLGLVSLACSEVAPCRLVSHAGSGGTHGPRRVQPGSFPLGPDWPAPSAVSALAVVTATGTVASP